MKRRTWSLLVLWLILVAVWSPASPRVAFGVTTPIFISGAEAGISAVGATGAGTRIWDTTSPNVSISTTTFRNGLRSYRANPAASTANLVKSLTTTRLVGRLGIYWVTLPGVTTRIIRGTNANGSFDIRITSAGVLQAIVGAGTLQTGPTVSTAQWYRFDFDFNSSGATATLDWQVDGTSYTQATQAQASVNITSFNVGIQTSTTAEMFFDDIILSFTGDDYPFGDGKVLGFSPNASGTHSFTAGDFQNEASDNIALPNGDVHTRLDERPMDITDWIKQVVIRGTGYIRVQFEDTSETSDARGVAVISTQHSADTQVNDAQLDLDDGGTLSTVYNGDISQTSAIYTQSVFATPPSGGTWSQSKINALAVLWGYSGDVTPNPYLDAVMLEVEWAPSAPPSSTKHYGFIF